MRLVSHLTNSLYSNAKITYQGISPEPKKDKKKGNAPASHLLHDFRSPRRSFCLAQRRGQRIPIRPALDLLARDSLTLKPE